MTIHDVITLNGNNRLCNKTRKTTGLAKRPYVVAGLQSQCFYPLHPEVTKTNEERALFLKESEPIYGQDKSKGQTTCGEKHNSERWWWFGETYPRLGGVSLS